MKAINLDMDGTIVNFYGVDNWLESLKKYETKPYREAKPLVDMRKLARELRRLQSIGYKVNIISWLSKTSTDDFDERVTKTKKEWLKRHLGSVHFDEIHIVKYGTPKYSIGRGILFDDEERNRKEWNKSNNENIAFNVDNILKILESIK